MAIREVTFVEIKQLCAMIKQRVSVELRDATGSGEGSDILIDALYVLSRSVLPKLGSPRRSQEYLEMQEAVLDLISFLAIQLIRCPAQEGRGVAVLSEIGEGCLDPLLKRKLSVYAQELLAKSCLQAEKRASGGGRRLPWMLGSGSAAVLALFLAWQMPGLAGKPERVPVEASNEPAPVPSTTHPAPVHTPSVMVQAAEGPGSREQGDHDVRQTTRSVAEVKAGASHGEQGAGGGQTTKVRIVDNQVLVPVMLKNGGGSVKIELVLDTGATRTAIHDGITSRLPIDLRSARTTQAELADGRVIWSRVAKIDALVVGPFAMAPVEIGLFAYNGTSVAHDGLLGMDFLGKHRYQIDMEHELIRWF